jgi:hypothetical protein
LNLNKRCVIPNQKKVNGEIFMIVMLLNDALINNQKIRNAAPYIDFALSAALLAIALLGTYGVIPMSNSISNALLGAGGFYLGILTLGFIGLIKDKLCN